MTRIEGMKTKIEGYIKFLLIFLVVFITSRNVLELFLGSYIKLIPDILILFLAAFFFIYKKGKVEFKLYDGIILLFLSIAFVNTVILKEISLYIYVFEVRSIMVYYILFFVVRNFEFDSKYKLLFTKIIRCIVYMLFVLGVIEKISNKMILFPASIAETIIYQDNYARVYSVFFNPNTYGAFLVISFFLVLHLDRSGKQLLCYKIITVASLLLSMSRSSILIFVMGLVGYAIVFKGKELFNKRLILQVAIVVASGFLLYWCCEKTTEIVWTWGDEAQQDEPGNKPTTNVYDRFNDLKDDEIVAQSNTDGRLFCLKKGFEIFRETPILGKGFGTYGSAASMNWEPPHYEKYQLNYGFYSDNEYIKDLVETGILGLLLLGLFCLAIIYDYRRRNFSVLMCVIVLWLGLFYNVLEVQIVAFLFWAILGLQAKGEDERNSF